MLKLLIEGTFSGGVLIGDTIDRITTEMNVAAAKAVSSFGLQIGSVFEDGLPTAKMAEQIKADIGDAIAEVSSRMNAIAQKSLGVREKLLAEFDTAGGLPKRLGSFLKTAFDVTVSRGQGAGLAAEFKSAQKTLAQLKGLQRELNGLVAEEEVLRQENVAASKGEQEAIEKRRDDIGASLSLLKDEIGLKIDSLNQEGAANERLLGIKRELAVEEKKQSDAIDRIAHLHPAGSAAV